MSYIEDYGLDNFTRSRVLVTLSLLPRGIGILYLNKILRYFEYLKKTTNIDFSHFKLGDVSDEIRDSVETLSDYGLIKRTESNKLKLTDEGETAEKEVEKTILKENEKRILKFAVDQLKDLETNELLGFMYFLLPESREYSTEYPRIEKNKIKIIKSLYIKGKISTKTAANWLDITEEKILNSFGMKVGI